MDYSTVNAIELNLAVDDSKLSAELFAIPHDKWLHQEDPENIGYHWQSLFLTKNNVNVFTEFKSAKAISHSEWHWDESLNIPYIQELVSSLPITTLGMVRAFITNGPLAIHVDSNETTPDELSFKLGLTIASKLVDPMVLGNDVVPGKYVLFNDAIPHGFPTSTGQQISIRVFGDFDYNQFDDKIVKVYK